MPETRAHADYPINRSWAEVDLDAIEHNVRALRHFLWRDTEIMCVVKADAYGHGVQAVVPRMVAAGADRLAVSMLDEAIQLRRLGVELPILVLSYTDPARAEEIVRHNITQTVYSHALIEAIDRAARRLNVIANLHIKIDTGMGRVGFVAGFDTIHEVARIAQLPHIRIEGVFTHFATADEDDTAYVREQFARFLAMCQELERMGIFIPIKHCCNSAATLRFPEMHLNMVRPGLVLYGQMPDACSQYQSYFEPAMSLHSEVIHTKTLGPDASISYGRRFVTARESRIATIPIGYADGYPRALSGKAEAIVHGRRVPVVGSVCMDACMLDVTDLDEEVRVGDEVTLFGRPTREHAQVTEAEEGEAKPQPPSAELPVDEVGSWADTIAYEMLCVIGKRVPRVYRSDGEIERIDTVIV